MEKVYFDNKDVLADYGVFLMGDTGLIDALEIKKNLVHEWEDENGEDIYLDEITFEKRAITLDLGIKADTKTLFKQKLAAFYNWLQQPGLRQLRLTNLEFVYMVYLDKSKPFNRMLYWNNSLMAGTVKMNFVAPEPVSRQFLTDQDPQVQVSVSINALTDDPVWTIHWGDGEKEPLKEGLSPVTHDYASTGDYYIVITGRIDKIDTLTVSNSVEVTW